MHRSAHSIDGMEIRVVGPLPLQAGEPNSLLWVVKVGQLALGSVRLNWAHHTQVAELRDLQLQAGDARTRQAHSSKLMTAVAEYAREHGILKLKVNENSRCEWLPQQLSKLGFSDAARNDEDMQFYLDLYHRPLRRRDRRHPPRTEFSMAC